MNNNTFNHLMDIGIKPNNPPLDKFANQPNFSYFAIDDYWGLKEKKVEHGFFDFSDTSLYGSIQENKFVNPKTENTDVNKRYKLYKSRKFKVKKV